MGVAVVVLGAGKPESIASRMTALGVLVGDEGVKAGSA